MGDEVGDDQRVDSIDVFISYGHADLAIAREMCSHLEVGGYRCWLAPDDVTGPTTWADQIVKAIEDCRVLLVLVSSDANGSDHVSKEVDLAVEYGKPLLPVRIEDFTPSGTLRYLLGLAQWVDAFPGPIEPHTDAVIQRLATLVSHNLSGTNTPPVAALTGETQTSSSVIGLSDRPPSMREDQLGTRPWMRRVGLVVAGVVAIAAAAVGAYLLIDDPPTKTPEDSIVAEETTAVTGYSTTGASTIPPPVALASPVEIRVTSTTDWAILTLEDGAYWTDIEIVDASPHATVSIGDASVEIRQPIEAYDSLITAEVVLHLVLNGMHVDSDVSFELSKGDWGSLYLVFVNRDEAGQPTYYVDHFRATGASPGLNTPFSYRLPVALLTDTTPRNGASFLTQSADNEGLFLALRTVFTEALNLGPNNPRPIFMLNRIRIGETSTDNPERVLTEEEQIQLAIALADVGTIEFIDDQEEVLTDDPCRRVIDNGLTIRVWEIERNDEHAVFEITEFTACLAGGGWRIELEMSESGWTVTYFQMTFIS